MRTSLWKSSKVLPRNKCKKLLDENEGDIEETTVQLLAIVGKQEEEAKKKAKKERRGRGKEKEIGTRSKNERVKNSSS